MKTLTLVLFVHGLMLTPAVAVEPVVILEKPFPDDDKWKELVSLRSFAKSAKVLEELAGKKVILPEGIDEWPNQHSEKNWGLQSGVGRNNLTVKQTFEYICLFMGVTWKFDAERDVIVLTPQWKRDTMCSGKELITTLLERKPVDWMKLEAGEKNGVGGRDKALDDWRIAFDALISKPENYAKAGSVRLFNDTHTAGGAMSFLEYALAETLTDDAGRQRILVLNWLSPRTSKSGPGNFAYYLFDPEGKWIKGGVYSVDYRRGYAKIRTENNRKVVVEIRQIMGPPDKCVDQFCFSVAGDDLILESATNSEGQYLKQNETVKLLYRQ